MSNTKEDNKITNENIFHCLDELSMELLYISKNYISCFKDEPEGHLFIALVSGSIYAASIKILSEADLFHKNLESNCVSNLNNTQNLLNEISSILNRLLSHKDDRNE